MIAMTSLISTISHLSGPSVYLFWAISMQSCLAMIIMPGSPYNAKDMLTSFTIPFTTDQDERAKHSSLDSHALGIINSSLAHNILMYGKENAESLWNYLHNKYGSLGPASVFTDYQHTKHFQISGNSDPAPCKGTPHTQLWSASCCLLTQFHCAAPGYQRMECKDILVYIL